VLSRVQRAVKALDAEQRLAGLAAIALAITMLLPWYSVSVARDNAFVGDTRSAFGVFSFVEAAVLLVALGVLVLLFARGERRGFHLPGGDGTVILAAGAWAAVLLLWRVFDRPDVAGQGVTVGITWGFFFAFIAAASLALAGLRMRQAGHPEPPNPAAAEPPLWTSEAPARRTPRRPPAPAPAPEAPTRVVDEDDSGEFRRPPEFRLPGEPREPRE
jgi:hypothetical protein